MLKTDRSIESRIVIASKVYSMNSADDVCEAFLVRQGRIVATGQRDEILALRDSHTIVEDLADHTVIPGLIDAHVHFSWTAEMMAAVNLDACGSIMEIQSVLAARVGETPVGEWIRGGSWDESHLKERRNPTRFDLDPISPDHPVVIDRGFNGLVANSVALKAALGAIEFSGVDLDAGLLEGCQVDAEGLLTGYFKGAAKGLILNKIPRKSTREYAAMIGNACRAFNAAGITMVEDPGVFSNELEGYLLAATTGQLTVRSEIMLPGWGLYTYVGLVNEDGDALTERLKQMPFKSGFGDGLLRLGGVKILVDGGIGDATAVMRGGYDRDPSNHGEYYTRPEDLHRFAQLAHSRDLAIDFHACGDEALELTAETIARLQEEDPRPWLRHRIHHIYFPTERTLSLMRKYSVPAILTSVFIESLADGYMENLGEDLIHRIMPARTVCDAGIVVGMGADTPVADFNPWQGMYALCARRTRGGRLLDQAERFTIAEALKAYTAGGAFALGREHDLGTLEPGKWADYVVLDKDPLMEDLDWLRSVKPLATSVAGKYVFDRRGA